MVLTRRGGQGRSQDAGFALSCEKGARFRKRRRPARPRSDFPPASADRYCARSDKSATLTGCKPNPSHLPRALRPDPVRAV